MKKFILLTLFCSFLIQANTVEKHNIQVTCVNAVNYPGKYFFTELSQLTMGDLINRFGWYPVKLKIKNNSETSIKSRGLIDLTQMNFDLIKQQLSQAHVLLSKKKYDFWVGILIASGLSFYIANLGSIFSGFLLIQPDTRPIAFAIYSFYFLSSVPLGISFYKLFSKISSEKLEIIQGQLNQLLLLDQEIAAGEEVERFIFLSQEAHQKGLFTLCFEQDENIFGFDCVFREHNLISQE